MSSSHPLSSTVDKIQETGSAAADEAGAITHSAHVVADTMRDFVADVRERTEELPELLDTLSRKARRTRKKTRKVQRKVTGNIKDAAEDLRGKTGELITKRAPAHESGRKRKWAFVFTAAAGIVVATNFARKAWTTRTTANQSASSPPEPQTRANGSVPGSNSVPGEAFLGTTQT